MDIVQSFRQAEKRRTARTILGEVELLQSLPLGEDIDRKRRRNVTATLFNTGVSERRETLGG